MAQTKTQARAHAGPVAVQFIVTTTLDKTDADTRRLIRSHVMRGKNKGKTRPTKSKRASPPSPTTPVLFADAEHVEDYSSMTAAETHPTEQSMWVAPRPRMVATDLDLFETTSGLTPSLKDLISKAFNVVKPATFASQLFGRPSDSSDLFCFSNLSLHPAMLPSLLFTAQAYHDIVANNAVGDTAQRYLAQALRQLQQTLADAEGATSYSTMVVVASLATGSLIAGDLETAKKHLDGLYRILNIRGGIQTLQKGGMIEYKAQSMDLALHMGLGTPPRFVRPDITYDPAISPLEHPSISQHFPELSPLLTSAMSRPDDANTLQRLLNAYADCRSFCDNADTVRRTGHYMAPALFVQLGRSVTYRLLHLPGIAVREGLGTGTAEELLRLGMLSFVKTVLIRASWIGKRMVYMKAQVEETLKNRLAGPVLEWPKLLLWGLWIGALAVLDDVSSDGPVSIEWVVLGMKRTINSLGLNGWEEVKAVLKEFLWIDVLHDDDGRKIYQSLGMPGERCNEVSGWMEEDAAWVSSRELVDESLRPVTGLYA
ncbi:hypothetical protein QBC39DRAFT_308159 [Podospora conica]|nr:hypothetical protein QBC39DRAFT_308159 [Schizothecium conicum]